MPLWLPFVIFGGVVFAIARSNRQPPRGTQPIAANPPVTTLPTGGGDVVDISEPLRTLVAQQIAQGTNPIQLRGLAATIRNMGYPLAAIKLEARALQLEMMGGGPTVEAIPFLPGGPATTLPVTMPTPTPGTEVPGTTYYIPPGGGPPVAIPPGGGIPGTPGPVAPPPVATEPVPISGPPAFVRQGTKEYGYGQLYSDGSFVPTLVPLTFVPPPGWARTVNGYLYQPGAPVAPDLSGECPAGKSFNEDTGLCQ